MGEALITGRGGGSAKLEEYKRWNTNNPDEYFLDTIPAGNYLFFGGFSGSDSGASVWIADESGVTLTWVSSSNIEKYIGISKDSTGKISLFGNSSGNVRKLYLYCYRPI